MHRAINDLSGSGAGQTERIDLYEEPVPGSTTLITAGAGKAVQTAGLAPEDPRTKAPSELTRPASISFHSAIAAKLRGRWPRVQPDLIEDALQEAELAIASLKRDSEALDARTPGEDFSYRFTTAHRTLCRVWREAHRSQRPQDDARLDGERPEDAQLRSVLLPVRPKPASIEDAAAPDAGPAVDIVSREDAVRGVLFMRAAIESAQAEILLDERPYAEIAKELGISKGALRVRLCAARMKVAELLAHIESCSIRGPACSRCAATRGTRADLQGVIDRLECSTSNVRNSMAKAVRTLERNRAKPDAEA